MRTLLGCWRVGAIPALLALAPARTPAQTGTGTSTTTGVSNAFNPAMSLNGLFLGSAFSHLSIPEAQLDDFQKTGLRLQEMEMQFTSTIDPYSKADAIVTFENGKFDVEEAIVSTTALPYGIGFRGGKMHVPIGIENVLHTHALPFVQRSLVGATLFEEPLAEFGVEASYLLPTPFFFEVRGAAYNGDAEQLFGGVDRELAYLGGASALWDLGESSTFSIQGDWLGGRNAFGKDTWTQVASGGVNFRWRPTFQSIYHSLRLTGELLYGDREATSTPDLAFTTRGAYGYAQYQFARRWWVQGRYDYEKPHDDRSSRTSALLAFVPSEFQAMRLQVSVVDRPENRYSEAFLQYNFTIGSHPAHKY